MVGESQRAFYGNQFGNTFPLFEHYRVPMWVPEVGGPIDPENEDVNPGDVEIRSSCRLVAATATATSRVGVGSALSGLRR